MRGEAGFGSTVIVTTSGTQRHSSIQMCVVHGSAVFGTLDLVLETRCECIACYTKASPNEHHHDMNVAENDLRFRLRSLGAGGWRYLESRGMGYGLWPPR
jgi:hypothetical protein